MSLFESPVSSASLRQVFPQTFDKHSCNGFEYVPSSSQQSLINAINIWKHFQPAATLAFAKYQLNILQFQIWLYPLGFLSVERRRYIWIRRIVYSTAHCWGGLNHRNYHETHFFGLSQISHSLLFYHTDIYTSTSSFVPKDRNCTRMQTCKDWTDIISWHSFFVTILI